MGGKVREGEGRRQSGGREKMRERGREKERGTEERVGEGPVPAINIALTHMIQIVHVQA